MPDLPRTGGFQGFELLHQIAKAGDVDVGHLRFYTTKAALGYFRRTEYHRAKISGSSEYLEGRRGW
jgi:hypothetical protein